MHPNFTGVWKLIRSESDFGFLPPPHLRVDTISHEDPVLKMRTRQKDENGDVTLERDLTIGDEPVKIAVQGKTRRIRAFWEDSVLVVETKSETSGKQWRIEDRWKLDEDGEWLTLERMHEQPGGGAVRQRLRMQKRIEG